MFIAWTGGSARAKRIVVIGLATFCCVGLRADDSAPTPAAPAGDFLFQNAPQPAARQIEIKPELARLDKIIVEQEQAIHQLCQPVPHVFRLEPVNP